MSTEIAGSVFVDADSEVRVDPKVDAVHIGSVCIHVTGEHQARAIAHRFAEVANRINENAQARRGHPDA